MEIIKPREAQLQNTQMEKTGYSNTASINCIMGHVFGVENFIAKLKLFGYTTTYNITYSMHTTDGLKLWCPKQFSVGAFLAPAINQLAPLIQPSPTHTHTHTFSRLTKSGEKIIPVLPSRLQ